MAIAVSAAQLPKPKYVGKMRKEGKSCPSFGDL